MNLLGVTLSMVAILPSRIDIRQSQEAMYINPLQNMSSVFARDCLKQRRIRGKVRTIAKGSFKGEQRGMPAYTMNSKYWREAYLESHNANRDKECTTLFERGRKTIPGFRLKIGYQNAKGLYG